MTADNKADEYIEKAREYRSKLMHVEAYLNYENGIIKKDDEITELKKQLRYYEDGELDLLITTNRELKKQNKELKEENPDCIIKGTCLIVHKLKEQNKELKSELKLVGNECLEMGKKIEGKDKVIEDIVKIADEIYLKKDAIIKESIPIKEVVGIIEKWWKSKEENDSIYIEELINKIKTYKGVNKKYI